MREYLGQRHKMGFAVFTYRVNGVFIYTGNGNTLLHATTDDVINDEIAKEANFLTAWQNASGFVPFTVLRRYRGTYRRAGQTFIPKGATLKGVKVLGRGQVSASYEMQ